MVWAKNETHFIKTLGSVQKVVQALDCILS